MKRMKLEWKKFLIALMLLPIVVFFSACSCSGDEDNSGNGTPSNTTYTIHFYTGTEDTFNISSQTVAHGGLVRRPDNPVRTGYVFIGWYKDMACTEVWTFEIDVVTCDMTLYARWQKRQY